MVMKPLFLGILLASAFGLAQGAAALTLDTRTPANPDGSAKFVDPDQKVDNLTSPSTNGSAPGMKSFRSGNTTFSFGVTHDDGRSNFGRVSPFNNFGANRFRGFDSNQ
jgi:hypothetical protein